MTYRNTDVDRWYEFAVQQTAAESYLDNIDLANVELVTPRLLFGNNHYSIDDPTKLTGATRFTERQAAAFLARYTIVDHYKNDNSGFSATLLLDRITKEYTLSFRSTEYKNASQGGDFERDGFYGADGEIGFKGFAFGQIASMEKYFSQLKQGILAQGQTGGAEIAQFLSGPSPKLNVTGYSLGGHLANAFVALHPDDVLGAYLYNSAGLGRTTDGSSLISVMARYSRVLYDPASEPASAGDPIDASAKAAAIAELAAHPNSFAANLYEDPRYVWAARAVSKRTIGTFVGTAPPFSSDRITQLYGHAPHGDSEQVANSGSHVRDPIAVFIEDQPDIENWGGKWPFAPTSTEGIAGDFGNTHSLTLLGDSLALIKTFMAVDPSLTKDKAEQILSMASNQRGVGSFGTTGVADGDSLEAALDALRKVFSPQSVKTPFDRASGGYGKLVNRNQFHQNISTLEQLVGSNTYSILPTNGDEL